MTQSKSMKKIPFILSFLAIAFIPMFSEASPIIRSGETISIDATQVLQGDFYGMAQKVSISGIAEHDVYVAGLNVTINAPIQQDALIVGGTVQIHGEVGDDVRVLGGEVTIGERVKGDVVVYGGTLHILSTAHVEGELIFSGERLQVDGDVDGGIHGFSKTARINALVGGDIEYTATESLSLGERTVVMGNVSYKSMNELVRAQASVVEGTILRNEIGSPETQNALEPLLYMLGILVFATLTVYFFGREYAEKVTQSAVAQLGKNGLIGLAVLIAVPFVGIMLMVSVVGVLVGLVLFMAYVSALILSLVLVAVLLGVYVQKFFTKQTTLRAQTVLIGTFSFSVVALVPVIGPLGIFALMMIIFGTLSKRVFQLIRR